VLVHGSSSQRAFVNVKKFSNSKEWKEVCLRADSYDQIECGLPVSQPVCFHIHVNAMMWGDMRKKETSQVMLI
jgi:hypothetical protein